MVEEVRKTFTWGKTCEEDTFSKQNAKLFNLWRLKFNKGNKVLAAKLSGSIKSEILYLSISRNTKLKSCIYSSGEVLK